MAAGFLHDADRGGKGFFRIALVGAKGQVYNHQRTINAADDARGVVDHVVQGDGQRGFVPGHHVGGTVADQNDINSGLIDQTGHAVVVGGEHGDALAALLHLH